MSRFQHPSYITRDAHALIAKNVKDVENLNNEEYGEVFDFTFRALAGIREVPTLVRPYDWAQENHD